MNFLFGWISDLIPLALLVAGVAAWLMIRDIGHFIGLGLIVAAGTLFGFNRGGDAARGECKSAEIQRELEIVKADRDRAREAAKAGERVGQIDDAELAGARKRSDELAEQLSREIAARKEAEAAYDREASKPAPLPINGKCPAPPPRPRVPYHDGGATLDDLRGLRKFGPD